MARTMIGSVKATKWGWIANVLEPPNKMICKLKKYAESKRTKVTKDKPST